MSSPVSDRHRKLKKKPFKFSNSFNTFSERKLNKLCEPGFFDSSEESDAEEICITLDKINKYNQFDISITLKKSDSIEKLKLPIRMTKPFRSEKLNKLDILFSGEMANASSPCKLSFN